MVDMPAAALTPHVGTRRRRPNGLVGLSPSLPLASLLLVGSPRSWLCCLSPRGSDQCATHKQSIDSTTQHGRKRLPNEETSSFFSGRPSRHRPSMRFSTDRCRQTRDQESVHASQPSYDRPGTPAAVNLTVSGRICPIDLSSRRNSNLLRFFPSSPGWTLLGIHSMRASLLPSASRSARPL